MTRPRVPFTLTPLPGESFDSWLEAYAARLHTSTGETAEAIGLPQQYLRTPIRVLLARGLTVGRLATVAAAVGLPDPTLAAMFHRPGPIPMARPKTARAVRNAWAPTAGTRYCPACLASNGGRFTLSWRLPWTFYCLPHNQILAGTCPSCDRPPRARTIAVARYPTPRRCGTPLPQRAGPALASCGADLAAAVANLTDAPRHRRAQLFIDTQLARASDSDLDDAARRAALDVLTDLSIVTFHLATPGVVDGQHQIRAHMLHADTLTDAVDLLTNTAAEPGADPLTALVRHHAGPRSSAVPESWRAASALLTARIVHRRDSDLAATQRLRAATTLPAPLPQRPPDPTDPATTRIHRIPDQIWSAWALRLLGGDTQDLTVFRQAAAVALLLPLSHSPLAQLATLTNPNITGDTVKHQLAMLVKTPEATTALRIITELGLALDHHPVPINYTRRRQLTAGTELIDVATWKQLVHTHHHFKGSRRRLRFARTYLYELLTAGSPATAPPPYTLPADLTGTRAAYHDFVLNLPAALADALAQHARHVLTQAGITDEPLQWQPPSNWVTVTTWPGVDPDRTDPAPLHQALHRGDQSASHIAQAHNLSLEHLRHVIRNHPLPGRTEPAARPGTILARSTADAAPRDPRAHYIDLAWLHEQYVTWQRTFIDIADEIGCNSSTLSQFAKQHGLPVRPRGGGRHFIAPRTAPGHPIDIPQPLRAALTGQDAQQRIDRFLLITEHHNISSTARILGVTAGTLGKQLAHLEHRCGGPLFRRRHHLLAGLTQLGNQLLNQAQHDPTEPGPRRNGQLCRPTTANIASQVDR